MFGQPLKREVGSPEPDEAQVDASKEDREENPDVDIEMSADEERDVREILGFPLEGELNKEQQASLKVGYKILRDQMRALKDASTGKDVGSEEFFKYPASTKAQPKTKGQPKKDVEVPKLGGDIRIGMMIPDQFGGKYRVIDKIGEGGMGAVFKVEDVRTGVFSVMKILHRDLARFDHAKARFDREMRTMARINNPFVLPINDVLTVDLGSGPQIVVLSSLIEGKDLFDTLRDERSFTPDRAAKLSGEIAIGLQAAHDQGVVHRDMKPENVFLTDAGGEEIAKIGDFGIAGINEEIMAEKFRKGGLRDDRAVTVAGTVFGTPEYMAPEMADGKKADGRADLYGLGIIMYRMLAGHLPFRGGNKRALVQRQISEKPKPFSVLRMPQEVPKWLEDIVFKLLEKDPDDRYQTANEVFAALKEGALKDNPEMKNKVPFCWDSVKDAAQSVQESRPDQIAA